jgi:hypothetical protein
MILLNMISMKRMIILFIYTINHPNGILVRYLYIFIIQIRERIVL